MAHGKLRRLVKNFYTAIANVVQTPSFLREECKPAKRLISASEAPGNTRKDEEYAIIFCFFRPTPYGFRQVVQHVSKHVAYEINFFLIHAGGRAVGPRK